MIVVFKVVDALVFFGTIILFSFICCFFLIQTSTNVFAGYKNSALMRSAPIPKVHAIAHANMDSREMDDNVKVGVAFISSYVRKKKELHLQIIHKRDDNIHLDSLSTKM